MNFATIGSIGAYTKAMKMQTLWKQKTDSGNFTQKTGPGDIAQTSEADSIRQQLDQIRESNDVDLGTIYAKLQSGKRLSADELAYLKEKDPEAYKKAKEIEAERARYEEELKKCRTKEDVERLKTMQMSMSMAKVNAIANDPAIPKEKKMELLMHENAKVSAVADTERKFVDSGRYDRLPSEAERNEEIRENREGRQPEQAKPVEETEPEEEMPEKGKVSTEMLGTKAPETTAHQEGAESEKVQKPVQDGHRTSDSFTKAAYAKNAYRETMSMTNEEAFDAVKKIKVKKA